MDELILKCILTLLKDIIVILGINAETINSMQNKLDELELEIKKLKEVYNAKNPV